MSLRCVTKDKAYDKKAKKQVSYKIIQCELYCGAAKIMKYE